MAGKTPKLNLQFDKNPIEAVRDASSDAVKAVKNSVQHELLEQSVTTAWNQLVGANTRKMTQEDMYRGVNEGPVRKGDLREGEEISFKTIEKVRSNIEPGIDYVREIIHAEKTIRTEDHRELRQKIEQITIELKKLSQSSKELQVQFKNVTVEALPQSPGKYHLNFFEWMLLTIQTARMNIESSATWSGVVTGKKSRKDYWSLAKKHGTSFSLSGERVVAQQVG